SLTARIPWSVQLSDIIKVGMRSSLDIVTMVVVPTMVVVHAIITRDPTDIGPSSNRAHAPQKRAARMTARPLSFGTIVPTSDYGRMSAFGVRADIAISRRHVRF